MDREQAALAAERRVTWRVQRLRMVVVQGVSVCRVLGEAKYSRPSCEPTEAKPRPRTP